MTDKHEETELAWTRRGWLSAAGTGLVGTALSGDGAQAEEQARATTPQQPAGTQSGRLPLTEFEPKSMLHVARPRSPARAFR